MVFYLFLTILTKVKSINLNLMNKKQLSKLAHKTPLVIIILAMLMGTFGIQNLPKPEYIVHAADPIRADFPIVNYGTKAILAHGYPGWKSENQTTLTTTQSGRYQVGLGWIIDSHNIGSTPQYKERFYLNHRRSGDVNWTQLYLTEDGYDIAGAPEVSRFVDNVATIDMEAGDYEFQADHYAIYTGVDPSGMDPEYTHTTESVDPEYVQAILLEAFLTNLSITKTDNTNTIHPLEYLNYQVTYSNTTNILADNVVVTDTLPIYIVVDEASITNAGTYDSTTHKITWNLGTVNPNTFATLEFRVQVTGDAPNGFDLHNQVDITTSTAETTTSDNHAEDHTTVVIEQPSLPNLTIEKDDGETTVAPGAQLTYIINYENNGDAIAEGVSIRDTLPENVIFIEASDNGIYDNQVVQWDLDNSLNPGDSGMVTVTVRVPENTPDGTVLENLVEINTISEESNYDDNYDDDITTVEVSEPQIQLNKSYQFIEDSDNDGKADPFDIIRYTLRVTNNGDIDYFYAIADSLEDIVDYGSEPFNIDPTNGSYNPDNKTISWWPEMNISAHNFIEVSFEVEVKEPSEWPESGDMDLRNVFGDEIIILVDESYCDVLIEKDDGVDTARPGETLTYTINYRNQGSITAENVIITDILPYSEETGDPYVTYVSDTSGITPSIIEDIIYYWEIGNLEPGEEGSFDIVVTINDNAEDGTVIENFVVIETDTYDNNPDNNYDDDITIIEDEDLPDVSVTKTDSQDPVSAGEEYSYIITYKNVGEITAEDVVIIDTFPAYITFVSVSSDPQVPYTYNETSRTITWTIGNLEPGKGGKITINVRVNNDIPYGETVITNKVLIKNSNYDSDLDNNEDEEQTTLKRGRMAAVTGTNIFIIILITALTTTAVVTAIRIIKNRA